MISLNKLISLSADTESLKSSVPKNVKNNRPLLGYPIMVKKLADCVAVYQRYEDKTKYIYLLDSTVAKQLSTNDFQVKSLFVSFTEDKQVRFSVVDEESQNTWVKSLVEALHVAQKVPVQLHVDHDAQVYTFEPVNELGGFDIDDHVVDEALKDTFDETYFIESMDHPMTQEILAKRTESIVAVDEVNSNKTDAEHLQKAEVVDSSALDARNRLDLQEIEREIENPSTLALDLDDLDLNLDDLNL